MRLLTPAVSPPFDGQVSYVLPALENLSHALALLPNANAELHDTTVYVRADAGAAQATTAAAVASAAHVRILGVG